MSEENRTDQPSEQQRLVEGMELEGGQQQEALLNSQGDVTFSDGFTLGVVAGRDAQFSDGVAGAVVAGANLRFCDSLTATMVIGGNAEVSDGFVGSAIVGGQANLENSFCGVLLSGSTQLGEGSRVLLNTTQALALGAAFGAVFGLLTWLLRKK